MLDSAGFLPDIYAFYPGLVLSVEIVDCQLIFSSPPSSIDMSQGQYPDNSCFLGDDVLHNIKLL